MAAERNPITSGVKEKDLKLNQDSGRRHPTIAELLIQIESKSYKNIEQRASLLITVWTCLAEQVGSFHNIEKVFHMLYRESAMMMFSSQWPKVNFHYKRGLARSLSQFSKAMGSSVSGSDGLCSALVMTIYDPWGDPVILHLLTAEQIDKRLVSDFINAEPFELLLIRIECLVNAHLSKAAVHLCRCCLEKTRMVPSQDASDVKWRWIFSEWLMWMLFKSGQLNELVAESANCNCHDGVRLIYHTYRSQREDSEALTETLINLFLVRDLLFHSNYCCTNELMTLWCDFQIQKQSSISEVQEAARKLLVGHASASAHFYLFVDILWSKFNISLLPLYLEFYIRGLTSDLNFLEIARQAEKKESVIEIENHIAAMYFKLSSMFSSVSKEIALECMLSSFSLDPTQERLTLIKKLFLQISKEKALKAAGCSGENKLCWDSNRLYNCAHPNSVKRKSVVMCDQATQVGDDFIEDDFKNASTELAVPCNAAVVSSATVVSNAGHEESLMMGDGHKVASVPQTDSSLPENHMENLNEIPCKDVEKDCDVLQNNEGLVEVKAKNNTEGSTSSISDKETVLSTNLQNGDLAEISTTANKINSDDSRNRKLRKNRAGSNDLNHELTNLINKPITRNHSSKLKVDANNLSQECCKDKSVLKNEVEIEDKIQSKLTTVSEDHTSDLIVKNCQEDKIQNHDSACEVSDSNEHESVNGSDEKPPENSCSEVLSLSSELKAKEIPECGSDLSDSLKITDANVVTMSNAVKELNNDLNVLNKTSIVIDSANTQQMSSSDALTLKAHEPCHLNEAQKKKTPGQQINHVILDSDIPGISCQVLLDFVIVLESLRNRQLKTSQKWSQMKRVCEQYLEIVSNLRYSFLTMQLNESIDSEADSMSEMTSWGNKNTFASHESDETMNVDHNVDKSQVLNRFFDSNGLTEANAFVNLSDIHVPQIPFEKLFCTDSSSHGGHKKRHKKHRNHARNPEKIALRKSRRVDRDLVKRKKRKRRKNKKEKTHAKKHHFTCGRISKDYLKNKKRKRKLKKKKEANSGFISGDYCSDFNSEDLMQLVKEHTNSYSTVPATSSKHPRGNVAVPYASPSGATSDISDEPAKKKRKQVSFDKNKKETKHREKHKHEKSKSSKKSKQLIDKCSSKLKNVTEENCLDQNTLNDYSRIVRFSSVKKMEAVQIRQRSVSLNLSDMSAAEAQSKSPLTHQMLPDSQRLLQSDLSHYSPEDIMKMRLLLSAQNPAVVSVSNTFDKDLMSSAGNQSVLKYVCSKMTSRLLSVAQGSKSRVNPESTMSASSLGLISAQSSQLQSTNNIISLPQNLPQNVKHVIIESNSVPYSLMSNSVTSTTFVPVSSFSSPSTAETNCKSLMGTVISSTVSSPQVTAFTIPIMQNVQDLSGSKLLTGKIVIPINQCGQVRSASSTPVPIVGGDTSQSLPGMIVVKNGSSTQIIPTHPQQHKTVSRLRGAPKIPISNIQNRARISKNLPNCSKPAPVKAIRSTVTKVSTLKPLLLTDQTPTSVSQPSLSSDQSSILIDQPSGLVDQSPAPVEQLSECDMTRDDEASVLVDHLSKSDKTLDKPSLNNEVPTAKSLEKCSLEEMIGSPILKNSLSGTANAEAILVPSAHKTSASLGEEKKCTKVVEDTELVDEKESTMETSDNEDKAFTVIKDADVIPPSPVVQPSQTEHKSVTSPIEDGSVSEDSAKEETIKSEDIKEPHDKTSDCNIDENSRPDSSVCKTEESGKLGSLAELKDDKESIVAIDISSPSPQNKASVVEFDVDSLASQSPVSSSSLSITTVSSDSPVSIVMTTAEQNKQLQPIIVSSSVRAPGKTATQRKVEGMNLMSEAPTRSFTSISDAVRFSLMDMDDATGSVENQVLQAFQVSHESSRDSLSFENQVTSTVCESSTTTLSTTVLTTPQSSIREMNDSPISQNFDSAVHGSQKELSECQNTLSRTTWILDDSTGNETATSRLLQKSSDIDSASESIKDDDRPKKKRKKKERSERDSEAHKFWCEICHRGFFSAYNLRRHCRNVHKMDLPKGTTDLPFSNPTSHVATDHATEGSSHSISFSNVQQAGVGQKVSDYVLQSPTQEAKSQEFSMTSPSSQHSTPIKTTPPEFQLPSPSRMPSHGATSHVPPVTPTKDFRLQTPPSIPSIQISSNKLPETTKSNTKFPRLPSPCASTQIQTVPKIAQMHQVTLCAQPAPVPQPVRQLSQIQASGLVPPLSSVACQAQQIQQTTQCPHFQANKPAAQPRIGQIQIMQHVGQIPQIHHVPHTHVAPKANPTQTFKKCVTSQHASKISESEQMQQQAAQLAQSQQLMANQRDQMQKLVQLRQSAIAASGLVSQASVSEAAALKSQFFQSQLAASRQAAASNQLQAGQRVQGAAYGLQAHTAAGHQFFSPSIQQGQTNCPHAVFSAQSVAEFSTASQTYPTIRLSSETNDGLEDLEQFLLENMPWSDQNASHHLAHQSANRPSSADSLTLTVPSQTTGMGIHRTAANSKSKTTISRPKPRKPSLPQCSKNLLGNVGRGVKKKPVPKKITKSLNVGCGTPSSDGLNQTPIGMQQTSLSMNSSISSVQIMSSSEDKQTGCNLMLSKLPSKSPPSYGVNETDSYSSDSVQCIKVTHKPQTSVIPTAGVNFNIFSQEPKITDKYLTRCDPAKLANASCSINSSNTQTMVSFLDPCNLGNKNCTGLETRKNCFESEKAQASADIGTSMACAANIVPIPSSSSCALKNPAVFLGMQNGESTSSPKSDNYLFNLKEGNLLTCDKSKFISEHPFLASKSSFNADGQLKSQPDLFLGGSKGDAFPAENHEADKSVSSLANGKASPSELSKVEGQNNSCISPVSGIISENGSGSPTHNLRIYSDKTGSALKPNLVEVSETIDKFNGSNETQEGTVNTISDNSVLTEKDIGNMKITNVCTISSKKFVNMSNSGDTKCIETLPNSVKSNYDALEECSQNNKAAVDDITTSPEKNVQSLSSGLTIASPTMKKTEVFLSLRDDNKSDPCIDNVDAVSNDGTDKDSSHLSVALNDENKFPVKNNIECHDEDQTAALRIALRIRKTVDGVNRINVDQDKSFKYSITQSSTDNNHLPVKKSNQKRKKAKQKNETDLEPNGILNNGLANKLTLKPDVNFSCENKLKDKKHKITPCDQLSSDLCLTNPCFVDLKKLDAVDVEERKRKIDVSSDAEKVNVVKNDEVLKGRSRLRDTPKTSVKRMCPCCVDSHVQKKCSSGKQNKHKQITLKARNGNSQNAKVNTRSSQRLRSRNNTSN